MPMLKRLKKEFKLLKELSSSNEKIYVYPLDVKCDAPTMYLAMIIGPDDTPYEGGFFYFHIVLPKNFPMEPPSVKFLTQGNNVRFNPNLYVNGKVCLSVIGTWAGPGWSPANTVVSVLQIIQGMVLNENPLINEPGYETAPSYKLNIYNQIVRFETYRTALLEQIDTVPFVGIHPEIYEYFTNITRNYFIKNFNVYYDKFTNLSSLHDGSEYSISYQNQKAKPDYKRLREQIIIKIFNIKKKFTLTDYSHIKIISAPEKPPGIKIKSDIKISPKSKLASLQKVALEHGINIKKQGITGQINKTKAELISEILKK